MKPSQIFIGGFLPIFSFFFLVACQSPEIEQSEIEPSDIDAQSENSESSTTGTLFQTETLESQPDTSFYEAVNKAIAAAEQTQTAKTANDWQGVVDLWQDAIELMNAVPRLSENHSIAQQRVSKYQKNQTYAITQQKKLQDIENQQ